MQFGVKGRTICLYLSWSVWGPYGCRMLYHKPPSYQATRVSHHDNKPSKTINSGTFYMITEAGNNTQYHSLAKPIVFYYVEL